MIVQVIVIADYCHYRLGGNREVSPFFCPTSWDTLLFFATFFEKVLVISKTFSTFADVQDTEQRRGATPERNTFANGMGGTIS